LTGSLYPAVSVLSTLRRGQVVDAAIVDGALSLLGSDIGRIAAGISGGPRARNLLDSGALFYDDFACADGSWIAVGAIEDFRTAGAWKI